MSSYFPPLVVTSDGKDRKHRADDRQAVQSDGQTVDYPTDFTCNRKQKRPSFFIPDVPQSNYDKNVSDPVHWPTFFLN